MNPPAKLYKYRELNANSIHTIVCSAVWFAEPASLNDPFDCGLRPTSYELTEDEFRELFTRLAKRQRPPEKVAEEVERKISEGMHLDKEKLEDTWVFTQRQENELTGLFCLCEDPANILMWSHYAGEHKGFCLEFSTDNIFFKSAKAVKYPSSYPKHRFVDCMNDLKLRHELTIFTKANLWGYEQEWRMLEYNKNEKTSGYYKFEEKA